MFPSALCCQQQLTRVAAESPLAVANFQTGADNVRPRGACPTCVPAYMTMCTTNRLAVAANCGNNLNKYVTSKMCGALATPPKSCGRTSPTGARRVTDGQHALIA